MILFHVLMGGAEHRALQLFDDSSLNLLIAASMLTFDTRWKKHLDLIHRKKKNFFSQIVVFWDGSKNSDQKL